ncbi:MAG: glycosyltransferase [Cyanobacteria bacterium]|nr:glycosyltransferase [Cyanobacteriota bacterium]
MAVALSVAIVSYQREQVLLDTLAALLALDPPPEELLLVDQTPQHESATEQALQQWQRQGRLRWIRLSQPSITAAMNRALQEAQAERVLFVDDDVLPSPQLLLAHRQAGRDESAALIAGRVLQPWHRGEVDAEAFLPFRWNTLTPRLCTEFIGCNFSVPRRLALDLGGFDQNFVRVAYRFEAEFAHRWCAAGHPLRYEPTALLHHLHTARGGTRSYGEHLTTIRPDHAVGRYYYCLRTSPLPQALALSFKAVAASVASRHHRRHPWWIPLTLLAELRGLLWALRLHALGPRLLADRRRDLLIVTTHPIQYQAPLFRALAADPQLRSEVLFLCLPDERQQGAGFGLPFSWDVPLLDGYPWRQARSIRGSGALDRYFGLWLLRPLAELGFGPGRKRPDAVLITGWQCFGMLQLLLAARLLGLPVLLRTEANDLRQRPWYLRLWHRLLVHQARFCLPIGKSSARYYRRLGVPRERLRPSPYFVDNGFFQTGLETLESSRQQLREQWGIPQQAFCFLFAGKLQPKKHPLDLLDALRLLAAVTPLRHDAVHLLIVGSGELEEQCRELVSRHQLPVSFAGFLNQGHISEAYRAADCLVLPSDAGETWGLVVNEAMACGLPALVSDQVGCAEDLVEPGLTGEIIPCGDIPALCAAMTRIAADPERSRSMGRHARERVSSQYTAATSAAGIREAVLSLVSSHHHQR